MALLRENIVQTLAPASSARVETELSARVRQLVALDGRFEQAAKLAREVD